MKSVVHSMWQIDGRTSFQKECIIPKGIIEIIFDFSDRSAFPAAISDKSFDLPRCFINGFNRAPIFLELPQNQTFFGVRFQPLAIKKVFRARGGDFLDSVVDATLFEPGFASLWHQLAEQTVFEARTTIFMEWIKKKWIDWPAREMLLNDFLCSTSHHDLSVREVSAALCYSSRQLSRKITEATGINTEDILNYKRYLFAMRLMHDRNLSLTEVAYNSGFSDQSHFIRTFRYYTRMTPGDYLLQKSFQKGHIYDNVR